MVQPNNPSTSHFESTPVSRSAPSGLKYVHNPAYMSDFYKKNHNEVSSDCSNTNTSLNLSSSGSSTSSTISTEKVFPTRNSQTYNGTFCTTSGSDRYFLRSTQSFTANMHYVLVIAIKKKIIFNYNRSSRFFIHTQIFLLLLFYFVFYIFKTVNIILRFSL